MLSMRTVVSNRAGATQEHNFRVTWWFKSLTWNCQVLTLGSLIGNTRKRGVMWWFNSLTLSCKVLAPVRLLCRYCFRITNIVLQFSNQMLLLYFCCWHFELAWVYVFVFVLRDLIRRCAARPETPKSKLGRIKLNTPHFPRLFPNRSP